MKHPLFLKITVKWLFRPGDVTSESFPAERQDKDSGRNHKEGTEKTLL
jgi:hypothetical protein